jgi:hypothetical protein
VRSQESLDSPEVAVARFAARISLWALCVSGGVLFISVCVFGLELRRWLNEGVRLSLTVITDARLISGSQEDKNTYVSLTVMNRGSAPTTITHMILYSYPSRLALWISARLTRWMKQQRPQTFIVANTGAPGPLPYVLEPGHHWVGMATHTPELERMIDAGRLYVGVIGSHSNKPQFMAVRRWRRVKEAKTA